MHPRGEFEEIHAHFAKSSSVELRARKIHSTEPFEHSIREAPAQESHGVAFFTRAAQAVAHQAEFVVFDVEFGASSATVNVFIEFPRSGFSEAGDDGAFNDTVRPYDDAADDAPLLALQASGSVAVAVGEDAGFDFGAAFLHVLLVALN